MTYYHATDYKNLQSILDKGLLNNNLEGEVYLCRKDTDAIKFPYIRGLRDILVVEVNIDENEVKESFDHSEAFFKCKAYRYPHPISTNHIIRFIRYQYDK